MQQKGGFMQKFLTPKELAERWHMSEGTLANWRYTEQGPYYLKIGGSILYSIDSVVNFEKESLKGE